MKPDSLDRGLCDSCGLCATVCGRGMFSEAGDAYEYRPGDNCIACGHCIAVCPTGALVRADGGTPSPVEEDLLPSAESLLHLLRSRRSCRRYKQEPPPRHLLERLVEAARYAPTGTNRQDVHAVLVTEPALIATLRTRIMARYEAYERHLSSPVKRFLLKVFVDRRFGDPKLRGFLKSFLNNWREGRDVLFHEAPVIALLYAGKEASTPRDDCCIALFQMVLLAERIGLGSCLLGTVDAAFAKTRALNGLVGIPRDRPVLAAAAFGVPAVRYRRLAERKELEVAWR